MSLTANIVSALASAVDAMATPDYNFNHPPVEVFSPAAWAYPQTFFTYPNSNGADTPGMAGKHQTAWPFTFRGILAKGTGTLEEEVGKYSDDILKLINAQHEPLLKPLGLLRFEFLGIQRKLRLVASAPCEVSVLFMFYIRQSRFNPSSP